MRRLGSSTILASLLALLLIHFSSQAGAAAVPKSIVIPAEATFSERLAAQEIRRYTYLRTGTLLPIETAQEAASGEIAVARKDRVMAAKLAAAARIEPALSQLAPQSFWLKSVPMQGGTVLLVTGGDDTGVLYAGYRLAEILGVRFYLHGDVIPDEPLRLSLPDLDEKRAPLFALRGIQPFHDFPEGPDWWNRGDYLAILSQLPKLRMNFFGLHTYPEDHPNAEPTVWIGATPDIGDGAKVKFSYPSSYQNSLRGNWGYAVKKTSAYAFGADRLFERDDFAADVMGASVPNPTTPEDCNAVFEQSGLLLRDAFTHARQLGIKTCVGTETPLVVPKAVREHLKAQGKNPDDLAVTRELYAGMFRRITQTYPLDYFWFWTPEGWTWDGTKPEQVAATTNDLLAAISALKDAGAPFSLATCGWVLGPEQDRSLFDKFLPKSMPVSCINRQVGNTPVESGFAGVQGRGKWAIPWMEDDPGLTAPQLWAGRMRRDARDALRYGCDGLMGIHWRTRVLGPAVSSLAQAAWDQSGWGDTSLSTNFPSVDDFYRDWATGEFGTGMGTNAAVIFARIDGHLPRPADWTDGPGGIKPDPQPWEQVARQYAFVSEFEALAPNVKGAGNRERFKYWLNTFRYMRTMGELNCLWAKYDAVMARVKTQKENQKDLARAEALPIRIQMVKLTADVYRHLLALVSNPGEMGTVMNWERLLPGLLTKPGEELARILGEPLPAEATPDHQYSGPDRLIVPTSRTSLASGEAMVLKAIVLSAAPVKDVTVSWRPLGRGSFQKVAFTHVGRGVYAAKLPPATEDFEYYITASSKENLIFPTTAPRQGQTVVVVRL